MAKKSHFLPRDVPKKAGRPYRFPLRYYKDNTPTAEMQIAFNFLLQIC